MEEVDTRYFFVDGIDFSEFCRGLSEKYIPLKIGNLNGSYLVGKSIVRPVSMKTYNALLVKDFTEGLDKYLEKEFNCKLS